MFLISLFGKMWYGTEEWDRKKRGLSPIREQMPEPYFRHELDRIAWERRKTRFKP